MSYLTDIWNYCVGIYHTIVLYFFPEKQSPRKPKRNRSFQIELSTLTDSPPLGGEEFEMVYH